VNREERQKSRLANIGQKNERERAAKTFLGGTRERPQQTASSVFPILSFVSKDAYHSEKQVFHGCADQVHDITSKPDVEEDERQGLS
jgi:hypothetical protein